MNLSKQKLVDAMKKCLPGVEKGSALIEGADAFLFSDNFIHTYNGLVAVSVPIDLDGLDCSVKALDFFKLISKVNSPIISGDLDGGQLKIQAGRTKAAINTMEVTTQSHIKSLNLDGLTFSPVPANFIAAVKLCKLSCNQTNFRGIYINGKDMLATDQARINHSVLDAEMDTVWLDDPAIAELLKLGNVLEFSIGADWAHFKLEGGTVFSARVKDHAQFPRDIMLELIGGATEQITEELTGKLPKALSESVDRVATMASGADNVAQLIRLTLSPSELNLYAAKDSGSVEDSIEWETPYPVDKTNEIWVEAAFLAEAAKKVMDFALVNNPDGSASIVFKGKGYTQLASTVEKE